MILMGTHNVTSRPDSASVLLHPSTRSTGSACVSVRARHCSRKQETRDRSPCPQGASFSHLRSLLKSPLMPRHKKEFASGDKFGPQRTSGNPWRHSWPSLLRHGHSTVTQWGGARELLLLPPHTAQPPPPQATPAPHVGAAKPRNPPGVKGLSWGWSWATQCS